MVSNATQDDALNFPQLHAVFRSVRHCPSVEAEEFQR